MCLYSIMQTKKPQPDSGFGWKVFRLDEDGKLRLPHYGTCRPITTGEWIDEQDWRTRGEPPYIEADKYVLLYRFKGITKYKSGWHTFQSLAKAKLWANECTRILPRKESIFVVRKVEYKGVRARGTQTVNSYIGTAAKTIVSQYMYVYPE